MAATNMGLRNIRGHLCKTNVNVLPILHSLLARRGLTIQLQLFRAAITTTVATGQHLEALLTASTQG